MTSSVDVVVVAERRLSSADCINFPSSFLPPAISSHDSSSFATVAAVVVTCAKGVP